MIQPKSPARSADLRDALRDEFRAAWQLLRSARPDDVVYGFGLYTGHDAKTLTLVAFTEQGLDDVAQAYADDEAMDMPNERLMLRWSPADSPLLDTTGTVLARSQALRRTLPDVADAAVTYYGEKSARRAAFAAAFSALNSLDEEGLFGEGSVREAVLLSVWQYDESDADMVAAARKLNPRGVVARYAQALDERGRVFDAWMKERIAAARRRKTAEPTR